MVVKLDSLSLNLPFGLGGVTLNRSESQRRAAWSLYIQLATRISCQPIERDTGSAREALSSLNELFGAVRRTLTEVGPDAVDGPESVGPLAIRLLNRGLRPFLSEWNTKLSRFEHAERLRLAMEVGPQFQTTTDEARWDELGAFRDALEALQTDLRRFNRALALVCGADLPESTELPR